MGRVKRKKGRESEALGRLNFRFVAACGSGEIVKIVGPGICHARRISNATPDPGLPDFGLLDTPKLSLTLSSLFKVVWTVGTEFHTPIMHLKKGHEGSYDLGERSISHVHANRRYRNRPRNNWPHST